MSKTYISKALRKAVTTNSKRRCGYCQTQERVIGMPLEIDHIIPEARGGQTIIENLCLACTVCNDAKGDRIEAFDPISKTTVNLFNPREQIWTEHFQWSTDKDQIIGLTAIGRATIEALKLNRLDRVEARQLWVQAGWHPPKD